VKRRARARFGPGVLDLFADAPPAPASTPEREATVKAGEGPAGSSAPSVDEAVRAAALAAEAASPGIEAPDGGPLTTAAAAAIRDALIEATRVVLDRALPREVYEEVADAFGRIGGRWVRAGRRRDDGVPSGYHAFPPESVDLVRALAETGRMPPRNPTSFFPSPPPVVDLVMEAADLPGPRACGYRFLEPHAGQGAIADRIRALYPECALDVVEILELNRRVLVRKGYRPIAADFLRFDPGPVYDRILANPPFRLPGAPRAYQAHIRHAWDLLAEGGVLVSVAPAGVLHTQRQDREFHRWLADRGRMEELPDGSFEASGTGVATALITLEKRSVGWKRLPFQGWVSWNAWQAALWADNTSELYEQELRIYERIRRGDFGRAPFDEGASWPLAAAARAFYEEAAEQLNRRPLYAGVYLSDEDHRALLRHLADRYHEYESYREDRDHPVRIAA
jgi:hypothetical protein